MFEREEVLYTVALASRRARKLFGGRAYAPDWSPTGGFIVFVREPSPSTGAGVIQSIRTGGRNLRSIVVGRHPDVSPDGSTIAFGGGHGINVGTRATRAARRRCRS